MKKKADEHAEFHSQIMAEGGAAVGEATLDATAAMRMTTIDVGKGDCILLECGRAAGLVDTGYAETSAAVLACLHAHGVNYLDFLVITHYDRDHVGGIRAIASAVPTAAVYLPGYEGADKPYRSAMADVRQLDLPVQRVTRETKLSLGEASIIMRPSDLAYDPNAHGNEGNDNDLSLVLELRYRDDSYLLAGDIEDEGIEAYIDAGSSVHDVLKMPHHGQKAGNTEDLIAHVKPKIAVITDSEDDPADKKTLKLLKKAGIETYCTSECGTVVVTSDGAGKYSVARDTL